MDSQVVQVVLPTGVVEVRLASIDRAAGSLNLRKLNLNDGGEVEMGSQASVNLSSIGAASTKGKAVLLGGKGQVERVLLELRFDTEALATGWAKFIATASSAQSARDARKSGSERGSGGTAAMLRALIEQQEEQVQLLETINRQKEEQLFQMQTQLEDALTQLQTFQVTYSTQQCVLDEQHRTIEARKLQQRAADAAEAACTANAMAVAAGARASSASTARSPSGAAAAASVGARSVSIELGTAAQDEGEEEDLGDDEAQALLQKLRELENEKRMLEEALANEHGDIAGELSDLQQMMAGLGLSGGSLAGLFGAAGAARG